MKKADAKQYLPVDCAECEATVKAEVLATHQTKYFDESLMTNLPDSRVSLVICPSCDQALVALEMWKGEGEFGGDLWSPPLRVWPRPPREMSSKIPHIVQVSLEEAQRCHRARAYTAGAVMCGRALEGICSNFKTKDRNLGKGLRELLDRGIVDERLFKWSQELQRHRNLAAHATGEKTSREDATDLLDFLNAICEYVFVLTPKFQSFMKRKSNPAVLIKTKGATK
jgi:uncharacterized protein DUF4145